MWKRKMKVQGTVYGSKSRLIDVEIESSMAARKNLTGESCRAESPLRIQTFVLSFIFLIDMHLSDRLDKTANGEGSQSYVYFCRRH